MSIVESVIVNQHWTDSDRRGESDAHDSLPIYISGSQKSSPQLVSSSLSLLDDTSSPVGSSSSGRHSPHPTRIHINNYLETSSGDDNYDSDADPEYHCASPKISASPSHDHAISSSSSGEGGRLTVMITF